MTAFIEQQVVVGLATRISMDTVLGDLRTMACCGRIITIQIGIIIAACWPWLLVPPLCRCTNPYWCFDSRLKDSSIEDSLHAYHSALVVTVAHV
jgi:hypothetical protein